MGCAVWAPLVVWMYLLVGWMITAEIDLASGVLGIGIAVGLGMLAFNPPSPIVPPLIFLGVLVTSALAPVAKFAYSRAELKSMDYDAMERAYELLGQSPKNVGGKLRMAKALFGQGYVTLASEIGEQAIQGLSEATFREEIKMVRDWRNLAGTKPAPSIRCVRCGQFNTSKHLFCKGCGEKYLLDYAKGRSIDPNMKRKIVSAWLVAMLALIGIPTAASALPIGMAIAVIVFLLIGSLLILRVAWIGAEGAV